MATIYKAQGDTGPGPLTVTLTDGSGEPIDLTGKDCKVFIRHRLGGALVLDGGTLTPDADQTANRGKATYPWVASDVANSGVYLIECEADDAKVTTYPNDEYLVLVIKPRLGGVA